MKVWKIDRVATLDDQVLADKLNSLESDPFKKIKEIIYMGDNSKHIRIYQIIYTEEY